MITHYKVQKELMDAIARSREARVCARKQVDVAMSASIPAGEMSLKEAFRQHALATAAHNRAVKELRDYHLNGQVPSHLEALAMSDQPRIFGIVPADDSAIAA